MKQVVNPSLKELKQALGDQYQICYIDMEKCLYRDFGNGFNVEVSGVSRANKNGPATLYLWFGTKVNDCFMVKSKSNVGRSAKEIGEAAEELFSFSEELLRRGYNNRNSLMKLKYGS